MKTKMKMLSISMIALFGLFLGAQSVSAQTVSGLTCSSATIYGTLDTTGGAALVSGWLEWGSDQVVVANGQGARLTSHALTYAPQTFTEYLSGLAANTTYYYRAVFANFAAPQGVPSTIVSFTTPSCVAVNPTPNPASLPIVTTNSAGSIGQNSATLNGYVTANGANVNAWFEYGTTQSFGNSTNMVNYGNTSSSFSSGVYNLAQNTTYYYRAVAQNSQGTVYGSTLSFTTTGQQNNPNPSGQSYVSTNNATSIGQNSATLNGYISSNGNNTSGWFEWGTSYSLGNSTSYNSYGSGSTSFNSAIYNLSPNTTYYYRAAAQSSYGTVYGNTLSFTTTGQTTTYVSGVAPTVSTLLATELTGTTARLNGLVFSSNGQSSNSWFEWGTTSSLGNKTQSVNVGSLSTVKHSDYISGLTSGQTYYYRIVAQNTYGTEYGAVNSFVSTATAPVATQSTPVVYKPVTTVVTRAGVAESLVMLTIEGGAEMIMSGEKRTYRVTWKNTSAQALNNVVLRVSFPQSMNVESATKGSFSSADNAVVVDLKTLAAGATGETFIFTTAGRGLKAGELLVVTANMVYTNKAGVQGDALAYMTHRAEIAQSALGANVFGAGSFTPTTLLGWISLLGLVLVLVLLGNHLYGRFAK